MLSNLWRLCGVILYKGKDLSSYNVRVIPYDEVYVKIETERAIEEELKDHFSFMAPNYKFHPKYKARIWNGRINLLDSRTKKLYKGLLDKLEEFCLERDYGFENTLNEHDTAISLFELEEFLKTLKLPANKTPRAYQKEAMLSAIRKNRRILLSPTASGKSLIIYCLLRYYVGKSLLIVPTISLVSQMYGDFAEYSAEDPNWDVEQQCSKIFGGQDKNSLNKIVISTWQSIHGEPKDWFDGQDFDVVLCDEVHTASAQSIKGIMEKLTSTGVRIGTTGTLQDLQVHEFTLTGLFGKVKRVIETKELIEQGNLAELDIRCIMCHYSPETMKAVKGFDYKEEIDFITTHERRNKFIANLALSLPGNTLVLFNYVEKQGKVLYELIKKKNKDKQVFFISGEIDADTRETIRKTAEDAKENCIIVASLGTFSTGVNLVALHNIIFAHPTKAKIRLLQSIGRGLRKNSEKDKCTIFDFSDVLTTNKKKNYTMQHFLERLKIYLTEGFPYKLSKVNIE